MNREFGLGLAAAGALLGGVFWKGGAQLKSHLPSCLVALGTLGIVLGEQINDLNRDQTVTHFSGAVAIVGSIGCLFALIDGIKVLRSRGRLLLDVLSIVSFVWVLRR